MIALIGIYSREIKTDVPKVLCMNIHNRFSNKVKSKNIPGIHR